MLKGADILKVSSAYCRTIHQSQGLGFDNVLVYFPYAKANSRELLYTAITRAKDPKQGGQSLHIWAQGTDDIRRVLSLPFDPTRDGPDNFTDLLNDTATYSPIEKIERINEAATEALSYISSLEHSMAEADSYYEKLKGLLTTIKATAVGSNSDKAIAEYWMASGGDWLNFRLSRPVCSISLKEAIEETMRQSELPRNAVTVMLIFYMGNGGLAPEGRCTPEMRYSWMLSCYKRTKNGSALISIDGASARITAVRNIRVFRHAGSFKTVTNKGLKERIEELASMLGYVLDVVGREERADKLQPGLIPGDDYKTLTNKELAAKYSLSERKIAAMRKECKQLGLPSERGKEACTRKTKASTITPSDECIKKQLRPSLCINMLLKHAYMSGEGPRGRKKRAMLRFS